MSPGEPLGRVEQLEAWLLPVSSARFVERGRAEALERLGISTVGDLLFHFPFRYIDLTQTATLRDVRPGNEVTVTGRVHDIKVKHPRPRMTIVEVAIVDGTGVLLGVWFNQPYMASRFVKDERVAFAGTVQLEYGFKQMRNPFVEKLGAEEPSHATARVLPVHRATEGLSTNWLRRIIGAAIDDFSDVPDFLPVELRLRRGLVSLRSALRGIHFPHDAQEVDAARLRLMYDELFCLQVGMAMRRHQLTDELRGRAHTTDGPALSALAGALPFTLTADQSRAVDEILGDMADPRPMNRMVLGDVGTGKTAVAAHALCVAADSGTQAAMMAPTEVLATQYAEKLGPVLDECGVTWALLTGSTPAAERTRVTAAVADGSLSVLFGTHALLERAVDFSNLSLAIVDEQHRFGVNQRLGLRSKGSGVDLLVMTATPIPRSLALTLYGDLETSYLRMRPTADGGHRITSELVHRSGRRAAYQAVRDAVAAGHQAYVICALVDESDEAQAKAAVTEARRLEREVFPDLKVGLLTGKMRPAEKAQAMRRFRDGSIDVLVATTVVEVGVDVPNATVMIVEDAERFGLAQLHQLRGRIGRGGHDSRFLLFADPASREGKERMQAIVENSDGFELAEVDLRLRGEGQLLGARQHGLPELRLASLLDDRELLDAAREDARDLIAEDPHLERPLAALLLREVKSRFGRSWTWVSSG